jgi:hypothetical protein
MTSALLGAFGVLHLANHWFTPLGPHWHLEVQAVLRWLYRNPIVEPVLLGSILVQVATGTILWYETRAHKGAAQPALRKWRRWSGAYLAFFLVAHTTAALVQRYVVALDSNFYWAAAVLRWPLALWFVPYYSLGIMSFVVHVAAAVSPRRVNAWACVGALSCVVIIGGLSGWFATFEIPTEYR